MIAAPDLASSIEPSLTQSASAMVTGHRWLLGEESLLIGCQHHRQAERIPLSEATRLLMNRCTGLLLAGERLDRASLSRDDADFINRNLAKAKLAFGDA